MTSVIDKPREYIQCECCGDLVWKMLTVIKKSCDPKRIAEFWCPECWKRIGANYREIEI
jgi:hypothetical protein